MRNKLRGGILLLLTVICLGSAGLVLCRILDYRAGENAYTKARDAAGVSQLEELIDLPEPETALAEEPEELPDDQAKALMAVDLEALRQTASQVLGWICIPDSPISYPLMRVRDNQEYLRRAWDGSANNVGSIFLECKNQWDLSDFNTIIYGHYMKNGAMFGSLHQYKEADYWASHPDVYLVTDDQVRRYTIFSSYEAAVDSDTYRLRFEDEERKQDVLSYYVDSSIQESEVTPTSDDYILTLSTCTGTGTYENRWVVQAVLTASWDRTGAE